MRTRRIQTVLSEFLARGILWLRVLLLGALMPVDTYGLVLVYLGIEGLLAAIVSYPFIKDVLVRQDLKPALYLRFILLFVLIAVPAVVAMMRVGELGAPVAVILLAAAFLNGVSQIALYVLRVADVRAHNHAKMMSSVLTTVLFLGLLPTNWAWLPIVYLTGAIIVLVAAFRAVNKTEVVLAQEVNFSHHCRGWMIYGSQAMMLSFPQYGTRLVIAASMSLADVAFFTQFYMLATALFFIYSALMITVEAELSRAAPVAEIHSRLSMALRISVLLVVVAAVHFGMLLALSELGIIEFLFGISVTGNLELLAILIAFTALSGLRVVANALALAASGRTLSLFATVAGALTLGLGLLSLIPTLGLAGIGLALALGQAVEVACLVAFVFVSTRGGALQKRS
jgi:hypothetical protein